MKVENIIKSLIQGTINSIEVNKKQSINKNDILVKFKKEHE